MRTRVITFAAIAVPLANLMLVVADEKAPRRPSSSAPFPQNAIAFGTDQCTGVPNGTPCDDGNACTEGDTCQSGVCQAGTPNPLEDVATISMGGSNKDTVAWTAVPRATLYDALRGSLSGLPVGQDGVDETCLANDISTLTWMDNTTPPAGTGFWYLSRGENDSCVGSYGSEGFRGIPSNSRVTGTCHSKCLGFFWQIAEGTFTLASASDDPCKPNPCGPAQCVVNAHQNADFYAGVACILSGPKPSGDPCVLTPNGRDGMPLVFCTQVKNVSYTCHCFVEDGYDCDP